MLQMQRPDFPMPPGGQDGAGGSRWTGITGIGIRGYGIDAIAALRDRLDRRRRAGAQARGRA